MFGALCFCSNSYFHIKFFFLSCVDSLLWTVEKLDINSVFPSILCLPLCLEVVSFCFETSTHDEPLPSCCVRHIISHFSLSGGRLQCQYAATTCSVLCAWETHSSRSAGTRTRGSPSALRLMSSLSFQSDFLGRYVSGTAWAPGLAEFLCIDSLSLYLKVNSTSIKSLTFILI